MNSLFLSPGFPPNAFRFCAALRARGATVLGIGDLPVDALPAAVTAALAAYVYEPGMGDFERLRGAVQALVVRHGAIDHLDSNGEHWLELESRLRADFDVPGVRPAQLHAMRSKLAMAATFASAGIPHPPGIACDDPARVRAFAAAHGYPLVLKPDIGSGAADTFIVTTAAELELALPLPGDIVQPFVSSEIVTYDGLVDASGRIVFSTSHVYDTGIMQIRQGGLDGHYYSLRTIPAALESLGIRAVAAFDVRARFFHLELFVTPTGYVALEMNIRPPGGFTTDMMSDACNLDVYDLWAAMITGVDLGGLEYERAAHTAHAGRRNSRVYRYPDAALDELLGPTLRSRRTVPDAFAVTMGNVAYLLRSPDLATLRRAIAIVHAVPDTP